MFCNFSINIGIYSKKRRGYVLMLKLVKEFGIKKSIIAGIFFITGLISLGYLMDNNEHIQYYHHQEGMSQGVGNLNHSGEIILRQRFLSTKKILARKPLFIL